MSISPFGDVPKRNKKSLRPASTRIDWAKVGITRIADMLNPQPIPAYRGEPWIVAPRKKPRRFTVERSWLPSARAALLSSMGFFVWLPVELPLYEPLWS
ncbi:hypothetical protein QTI33_26715 [Variovorax sp. J22P271]|uniref:hypothetical protein n=1 Tax=Variovorax davisae TaxID=3053515 RepID=UPI0025756595|nr:hypothetical protein [Variovorax sp. J22P271]MDM0035753.1 hypothetical protein [Variovorax sp. J22P271]